LLLRPSAITLALFSTFLPLSQNAVAQCVIAGNAITVSCSDNITATTLSVEAQASTPHITVTGSVTGTAGNFANNTLTLKGINTNNSSGRRYAYITDEIANFGNIIVDYRPPGPPAAQSVIHQGSASAGNPLAVLSESTSAVLNTGANANEAVKLDILCRYDDAYRCYSRHFKFVGNIQGDGGLTLDIAGFYVKSISQNNSLTLGGTGNTYTGLTTIQHGILKIGDGTNFSFGTNNNIHLDPDAGKAKRPTTDDDDFYLAGVIFNTPAGTTFDYNGVISGKSAAENREFIESGPDRSMASNRPMALTKDGSGTMTLFQDQTYVGDTLVTGGTLQIGNGGTTGMIGEGFLWVEGGAATTFILDRSDDVNMKVPNLWSNFIKKNDNTLTMQYFGVMGGSWDIQGGTVRIVPYKNVMGNTLTINLATDNTKLIIDADTNANGQKNVFTLGNAAATISGAGELIKDGVGTLILMGDAQHTGGTTINAGAFQIGSNIGGDVFINEGATLVFSPFWAGDISSPADIRGGGDLIKGGRNESTGTDDLSTVTLTGNLTHTGKTEILTGGLTLAGSSAKLDTTRALILHNGTTFTDTTGVTQDIAHLEVTGTATYTGDFHADSMQFNVTQDMIAHGVIPLDVTGTADIGGTLLGISVDGSASGLNIGDSFRFLRASSGVTGAPANGYTQQYGAGGLVGALISVGFGIECTSSECTATVRDGQIREESKSILQGHLSGMAALVRSGDFLASHGIAAAREQLSRVYDEGQKIPEKGLWGTGIQPFVAHSGGMVRHETGSHIKTVGYNFLAGVVSGLRAPKGNVLAGAFFEYGKAEFDAYNAFNNQSVTGDGDTHHRGLGLFGRIGMDSGLYAEGSVRGGKVDTVFKSDFLRDYSNSI
jgi:autotransporter-associated beta strand protein